MEDKMKEDNKSNLIFDTFETRMYGRIDTAFSDIVFELNKHVERVMNISLVYSESLEESKKLDPTLNDVINEMHVSFGKLTNIALNYSHSLQECLTMDIGDVRTCLSALGLSSLTKNNRRKVSKKTNATEEEGGDDFREPMDTKDFLSEQLRSGALTNEKERNPLEDVDEGIDSLDEGKEDEEQRENTNTEMNMDVKPNVDEIFSNINNTENDAYSKETPTSPNEDADPLNNSEDKLLESKLIAKDESSKLYTCTKCNYSSKGKSNVNRHVVVKHRTCYKCYETIEVKDDQIKDPKDILKDHKCLPIMRHNCTKCTYSTRRMDELKLHVKSVHIKKESKKVGRPPKILKDAEKRIDKYFQKEKQKPLEAETIGSRNIQNKINPTKEEGGGDSREPMDTNDFLSEQLRSATLTNEKDVNERDWKALEETWEQNRETLEAETKDAGTSLNEESVQ